MDSLVNIKGPISSVKQKLLFNKKNNSDNENQPPGAIFTAIKKHDVNNVNKLVKRYGSAILKKKNWIKNHEGENPFHALVSIGHQYKKEQYKIFNILLSVLPDCPDAINALNGKNHNGITPLEAAIFKNRTYLFTLFLQNGADFYRGLSYARELEAEKSPGSTSINTSEYAKCVRILEVYEKSHRRNKAIQQTLKSPLFMVGLVLLIALSLSTVIAATQHKKTNKITIITLCSVTTTFLILNIIASSTVFIKIYSNKPQSNINNKMGDETPTSNSNSDEEYKSTSRSTKSNNSTKNLTNSIASKDTEVATNLISSKKQILIIS